MPEPGLVCTTSPHNENHQEAPGVSQVGPALGAGPMDSPARLSTLILSSKLWIQCRDLGLYSNSSTAAHWL